MTGKIFRNACAFFIAALFLWSGAHKLLDPEAFVFALFRYRLLPHALINIAALWMAGTETLCALCVFLLPKWRKAALILLLLLLAGFTDAILISIFRGIETACGCFTSAPDARPLGWLTVLRNLGLILITLIALWPEPGKKARR